MPISGYFRTPISKLKFTLKSVHFAYGCFTVFIMGAIMFMFFAFRIQRGTFGIGATTTCIYYAVIITAMIEFIILARNWPLIMQRWTADEGVFLSNPYETGQYLPLESLVKRVAFTIIFFAFVEDTINFISAYLLNVVHMKYCTHATDFWRNFFRREHAYIVRFIPYHPALGVAIEVVMRVAKFTWHYIDVFIICVSLVLQRRFQQYNDRIRTFNGNQQPEEVWRTLRLDFLRLSELVTYLDTKLSRIILLSCASDMFFISVQLYNIFE
ncbi:AAEL015071-PA [Aedes aegypti]|uniref:AAEL015071-PA n=1 Tax=Aedes aegypti TaxID=7159 RepID=Q16EP6_AEDAE|nr:AAEL015071-PA [Aedes aegypti]